MQHVLRNKIDSRLINVIHNKFLHNLKRYKYVESYTKKFCGVDNCDRRLMMRFDEGGYVSFMEV